MVNRPKNIGTAAETAVVRAARPRGFPNADRLTLTGANDRGDVGLCPGVIIEVKGGDAARNASDGMIEGWLVETERERVNAHADVAFLVTQRAGVGPANAHRWWAWWRLGWIDPLRYVVSRPHDRDIVVRMQLSDALLLLRATGYGDPFSDPDANANVPGSVRVQEAA
jgi:hypothetical protein